MKRLDYEELFHKALHNAIHWQNRCCDQEEIIELFCMEAEANEFWPDWSQQAALSDRIFELEAQNAQLLGALKAAQLWIEGYPNQGRQSVEQQIRAAIAAVEEKP